MHMEQSFNHPDIARVLAKTMSEKTNELDL